MSRFGFKFLFVGFFFMLLSVFQLKAEALIDTVSPRRAERYVLKWEKLIPRYSKLQFAGGMGFCSLGMGWEYGKNKQWETDLLIGYIPKFSSDRSSFSFTLKQNFLPWRIPLNERFDFEPLETGLYMNKVFAEDFWTAEPKRYGGAYYKFATSLRFSVFLGQRITLHINKYDPLWKSISFFYEISTNDLYLISYIGNSHALKLQDILILSFGLKFQIL